MAPRKKKVPHIPPAEDKLHALPLAVAREERLVYAQYLADELVLHGTPRALKEPERRVLHARDSRAKKAALDDLVQAVASHATGKLGGRPADLEMQAAAKTAYRLTWKRTHTVAKAVQAAIKASERAQDGRLPEDRKPKFSASHIRKLKKDQGWDRQLREEEARIEAPRK